VAESTSIFDQIATVLHPVEEESDADVFVYAGDILAPSDEYLRTLIKANHVRKNVILILTTFGGSPDTAYRIARFIREEYKSGKFTLFVHTHCKSAGTIIAIAANELIMSDGAQLGPLDIQIRSKEEAGEMSSGLTPTQALSTLQKEAWRLFDSLFVKLRTRAGFTFSTKMAATIASRITVGLLRPVYEQIDPMRLGENDRAMRIAADYGERLAGHGGFGETGSSKSISEASLARLIEGYPSHSFVIDRKEASSLFASVRAPNTAEAALAETLAFLAVNNPRDEEGNEPAQVYAISWFVKKHEADKRKKEQADDQNTPIPDGKGASKGGSADVPANRAGEEPTAKTARHNESART
jgi:hypothetical protein